MAIQDTINQGISAVAGALVAEKHLENQEEANKLSTLSAAESLRNEKMDWNKANEEHAQKILSPEYKAISQQYEKDTTKYANEVNELDRLYSMEDDLSDQQEYWKAIASAQKKVDARKLSLGRTEEYLNAINSEEGYLKGWGDLINQKHDIIEGKLNKIGINTKNNTVLGTKYAEGDISHGNK